MTNKQLKAVEKYLKKAYDPARLILSTVQKNQGKQFVLNGYTAVMWNNPQPELDSLTQTPGHCSINFNYIVPELCNNSILYEDIILWQNLKKYTKWTKDTHSDPDINFISKIIYIFGKFFDIQELIGVADIIGYNIKDFYITSHGQQNPTVLFNADVVSLVLPLRESEKDLANYQVKIKIQSEDFLSYFLKGSIDS